MSTRQERACTLVAACVWASVCVRARVEMCVRVRVRVRMCGFGCGCVDVWMCGCV